MRTVPECDHITKLCGTAATVQSVGDLIQHKDRVIIGLGSSERLTFELKRGFLNDYFCFRLNS
jgi:hypothetical protein